MQVKFLDVICKSHRERDLKMTIAARILEFISCIFLNSFYLFYISIALKVLLHLDDLVFANTLILR